MTTLTYDPALHLRLSSVKVPYKDSTGRRVPGVTTVLEALGKDFKDWAAGLEREAVLAYLDEAAGSCESAAAVPAATRTLVSHFLGDRHAHSLVRQATADVGSVAHGRICAHLTGRTLWEDGLPPAALDQSRDILDRFLRWHDAAGLVPVASELGIVDDEWGVGGTLDYLATDRNGLLVLTDFKTGNANRGWPYDEVHAQCAAYAALAERAQRGPVARVQAVRVGREAGSPVQCHPFSREEMDAGLALFLAARSAHHAKLALARAKRASAKGRAA